MAQLGVTRMGVGLALIQFLAISASAQIITGSPVFPKSTAKPVVLPPPMVAPTGTTFPSGVVFVAPPTSSPQVHTVQAGAGGFKFTPQEISNVSVGDTVKFEFYPPDHSVARAEFGSACMPYEYTGRNKVGFWSTTQWVKDNSEITSWNLLINSTEPIFFYCAAPNSCTGEYMVGVINPNDTQTLDQQVKSAQKARFQVAPGEPIPAEASLSKAFPDAPTSSALATSASGDHSLSSGIIAGIAVGAVIFLAVCAALFYFVGRARSLQEHLQRNDGANTAMGPEEGHVSMSQYGSGGLGSPGLASAGYASPELYGSPGQSEFGFNSMHRGGGEQYSGGWGTPPPSQQRHLSMMSGTTGIDSQQGEELKYPRTSTQPALAELETVKPGQDGLGVELEAPRNEEAGE